MLNKIFIWFEKRINPYPDENLSIEQNNLKEFIYKSMQGSKKWIILLMIFGALYALFESFIIQIISIIVDWLQTTNPQTFLKEKKYYLIIMLLILLSSILLEFFQSTILFQTFNVPYAMRLRWWFHKIMLNQSISFFQNEFAGRISAKVMQTALALRDLVTKIINISCYAIVYFISSLIILSRFNLKLIIPFFIWILAYILAMKYFIPRLSLLSSEQANARSLMTGRVNDSYVNIMTIKLFPSNGDYNELNYTKFAMQDFIITAFKQMRFISKLEIFMHIINISLIASVILISIFLWKNQLITVGAIVAATTMSVRLNSMSRWIIWEVASIFEQLGIARDGIKTFSKKTEILDNINAKNLIINHNTAQINFNNVYFSYNNIKNIFEDFNLQISPGEKIGIVGKSGSGKTTLINLLLRFYDIQKGEICINKENIKNITQDSLRKNIAVVTQDISLLHRTIRENIMYGSDINCEETMIQASKVANAHNFIKDLSDSYGNKSYDSFVGERGVKLSGGQRQRISIARAIMKNSPILILDEATSALDSQTEIEIQKSLQALMQSKTVLAIAHRLSTIYQMDKLIVLDNGKIIESGTHEQLLKLNGLYATLWKKQSGGFILD